MKARIEQRKSDMMDLEEERKTLYFWEEGSVLLICNEYYTN